MRNSPWAVSSRVEADTGLVKQHGQNSPFQIAVHDGEEDLKKEVDSIYQYRYQVQPCFSGHHDCCFLRDWLVFC